MEVNEQQRTNPNLILFLAMVSVIMSLFPFGAAAAVILSAALCVVVFRSWSAVDYRGLQYAVAVSLVTTLIFALARLI